MDSTADQLPPDLAAAHAMILAERAARLAAEAKLAEAANAQAKQSSTEALIAHLKLEIEKLRRTLYGTRSERSARLLDQLELELEELEATATEDELAAERAAEKTQRVRSFERKRPVRQPFPDDIERERVVLPAPTQCPCCGSARLSKLGESVTSTLEEIPRRFKVIDTVREKFSCRDCEAITQPPAPFHATPRGYIGPQLLATILFDKFGQHQPLNRQSQRFKCEGIDLSVSTLADQVGAGAFAVRPIFELIEAYVLSADRLHGDDTKIPILAKGKADTGRIWTYVRDDRPFGGQGPPAALFYASRDRRGEHPARHLQSFAGILQADAIAGSMLSSIPDARRRRPRPPSVGHTAGGRSSNWPISPRTRGADVPRRRSRPLRWKRFVGLTSCSRSSARSMGVALRSGCGFGGREARRC